MKIIISAKIGLIVTVGWIVAEVKEISILKLKEELQRKVGDFCEAIEVYHPPKNSSRILIYIPQFHRHPFHRRVGLSAAEISEKMIYKIVTRAEIPLVGLEGVDEQSLSELVASLKENREIHEDDSHEAEIIRAILKRGFKVVPVENRRLLLQLAFLAYQVLTSSDHVTAVNKMEIFNKKNRERTAFAIDRCQEYMIKEKTPMVLTMGVAHREQITQLCKEKGMGLIVLYHKGIKNLIKAQEIWDRIWR